MAASAAFEMYQLAFPAVPLIRPLICGEPVSRFQLVVPLAVSVVAT
jgi:hypothetical protein